MDGGAIDTVYQKTVSLLMAKFPGFGQMSSQPLSAQSLAAQPQSAPADPPADSSAQLSQNDVDQLFLAPEEEEDLPPEDEVEEDDPQLLALL